MGGAQKDLTDVYTEARDVMLGGPGTQHFALPTAEIEDPGRTRGGANPTDQPQFVSRQGIQDSVP
jgi:hypothetical protein